MTKPIIHDETKKSITDTGVIHVSDNIDEGFVDEKDSSKPRADTDVKQNGASVGFMLPVSDSNMSAVVVSTDHVWKRKEGLVKETDEGISSLGSSLSDVEANVTPKCTTLVDGSINGHKADDSSRGPVCCERRWQGRMKTCGKLILVLILLYFFICSLDFLSSAFRLVAGKTAGSIFSNSELLMNPISGLMIGVLATVLLQSSSTSTSIIITMVSAGIINVRPAIPIIMGANIGTTVTNTIVSLAHSGRKEEFKRAFAGATVHDVFNWLTVLVLLPVEVATGCLFELTKKITDNWDFDTLKGGKKDLLKTITKPLTKLIVQIDKSVIAKIAEGSNATDGQSLLKVYCKYTKVPVNVSMTTVATVASNTTQTALNTTVEPLFVKQPVEKCFSLFSYIGWNDIITGIILLIFSLLMLSGCLILIVKLLHSILRAEIAAVCKKTINANFPGKLSFLTGYVAILVGAGMTILVQSSSVFTSALTPLVGVGCLELERMFPLTLGSNIGTTATGVLAALAAPAKTLDISLQLALCHLFFNILGIVIYYPLPFMRKIPLEAARFLGRTTAEYRWFAIFYLICMFMILPGFFFGLSMAGRVLFLVVVSCIFALIAIIVLINLLQKKCRSKLPLILQNWNFLPECLHSLAPIDRVIQKVLSFCSCCVCSSCTAVQDIEPDEGSIEFDDIEDSPSPIVKNIQKAKEQFQRVRTFSRSSQDGNGPYQMLMPSPHVGEKKIELKRLSSIIVGRTRTLSGGDTGSDESLLDSADKEVSFEKTELSFVNEMKPNTACSSKPVEETTNQTSNQSPLKDLQNSIV